MKCIVKKSVVELPQTTGSISDTTNIADKTTNTYSARIIDELTSTLNELANPTLITPDFNSNVTNANGGYYKIGKLIIVDITCKFTTTNISGVVPCYLPTPKTTNADGYVSLTAISLTDNSVAPSAMQGSSLKVIPANTTNTYRISGTYICA